MDDLGWIQRASEDQWNFGIILIDGTKVAFSHCSLPDKHGWVRLYQTHNNDFEDGCIEINERGMDVRVIDVMAFWERSTT